MLFALCYLLMRRARVSSAENARRKLWIIKALLEKIAQKHALAHVARDIFLIANFLLQCRHDFCMEF